MPGFSTTHDDDMAATTATAPAIMLPAELRALETTQFSRRGEKFHFANKNRRKLVVTVERILEDEENELNEESPLMVKARLLIEDLTAHYELVEELQKREKAVEELSKRQRGEITRVG